MKDYVIIYVVKWDDGSIHHCIYNWYDSEQEALDDLRTTFYPKNIKACVMERKHWY